VSHGRAVRQLALSKGRRTLNAFARNHIANVAVLRSRGLILVKTGRKDENDLI
jgi:hypothetical protein